VKLCAAKEQKEVLQSERSDGDRPKNIMKAFTQLSKPLIRFANTHACCTRSFASRSQTRGAESESRYLLR
jgi:hypothetical protein